MPVLSKCRHPEVMWDSDVDFDLAAFHAPRPRSASGFEGFGACGVPGAGMGGGREGCGSDGYSVLVFQFQGRILVRGAHRNSPPSQNFEFWSSQKLAPICQAPLRLRSSGSAIGHRRKDGSRKEQTCSAIEIELYLQGLELRLAVFADIARGNR